MPPKKKTKPVLNEIPPVQNNFADAIGYGQGSGAWGWPGGPTPEPVSSSDTLFKNLRWYMTSNMRQLLSQLYVELGLVQTVVNVPIDDGLRGGVMFKSKQINEEQIKQLTIKMDQENDLATAGQAAKWARLYGGGGIMTLVDGQDPMDEFKVEDLPMGTEVELRAIDMWEMFWDKQNLEGYDMTIQWHDFDYYSYYGEQVHKSRIMRIKGMEAPSFVRPRLRGWGLSVVEPFVRSLNQYLKSIDLSFEVLDEFKVDVYKVKNLVNTLLSPTGTQKVQKRIQMMNFLKNFQNALIMDSEDDWDHKQVSFAGLSETMSGIRMQIAADLRMPITKIFGTSVSTGFQTDQNDMENYNAMVESEIRQKLKYDILRIAGIRCQELWGFVPDDLEAEFKPLRELTAVDTETVKNAKFDRLFRASEGAKITLEEFRDACNKGNLFDIQLDTAAAGLDDGLSPDDDAYSPTTGKDKNKEPEVAKPDSRRMEIQK